MNLSGGQALDRSVSLQHQLFAELRAEMADGLWVGRTDFYTEKDVCERFDVSHITARAVLDKLAEDGWITRTRGRRALPMKGPEETREIQSVPLVTADDVRFGYELYSAETRTAPAEACSAFGLPMGSHLWQCFRLRTLRGKIHSVTHNAQLPAVGCEHQIKELNSISMIEMLAKRGDHVAILRRRVSAVAPPQIVASLLDLKLGLPTLLYTCSLHRRDDSIIEWLRVYMRPDNNPASEAFDLDKATWLSLNRP